MAILKHLLQESKTRFLQSYANNRVDINMEKPIISFTFDDVPRTALTNGIPILTDYDVKATFYVAMGLTHSHSGNKGGINREVEIYLNPDDIIELHHSDHDIACHTYSHYMLKTGTAEQLVQDACRNVRELTTLLGTTSIEHFSYPFGQVNLKEKKLLANKYKTMRSSRPGVNISLTDMYLLRATSIYSATFDKNKIKILIEKAERHCGWLIFYTHGVEDNPDMYSCTPDQLKWVIQQCSISTAQLLPVSKAFSSIMKQCTANGMDPSHF